MALKPTIYKFNIALSDFNRDVYEELDLTVALHPSETIERMMARVLAYCLNYHPELKFTKGLSTSDEPDVWQKNDIGEIENWIEVGEPDPVRIKKATRLSKKVMVYNFNRKSPVWFSQNQKSLTAIDFELYSFPWQTIENIGNEIERNNSFSVLIEGNSIQVSGEGLNETLDYSSIKL